MVFGLAVLNRVYNLTCLCPKQVKKPVLNRVWYYGPKDFNPDCEQSLSFLSLRTGASEKLIYIMKLICIISTE